LTGPDLYKQVDWLERSERDRAPILCSILCHGIWLTGAPQGCYLPTRDNAARWGDSRIEGTEEAWRRLRERRVRRCSAYGAGSAHL